MTTIPTIENKSESRCNTCSQLCRGICSMCGHPFCGKHLSSHAGEGCIEYLAIVRKVLWDEIPELETRWELVQRADAIAY